MRKIIVGLAWMAVIVFMASCSSKSEYTNAIPKDVSVIMSFDFESMAEKSGLNGKEGEVAVSKLTELVKSGLEGEAYKTAEKIIQHPAESGLSFNDKMYAFVTPHSNAFGVVAKVNDEGKVKKLLQTLKEEQICTALQSESGCSWTQAGDALCAFNNGTFLVLVSNKGYVSDLKETLLALMRQSAAESYVETKEFSKFSASKGDIVGVANMSFIPNELMMQIRMGISGELKPEDFKFLYNITFENGKIVIDSENLTGNEQILAVCKRQAEFSLPISGTYAECFPANTLLWAGCNINGQGIYDLLCENPTIKQALESPMLPIDVESIFASIKGDVVAGFIDDRFLAYADVTNNEFLESFEALRPLLAFTRGQMQLISTGKDEYEFRMYRRQSIWFGVKNNMLYVTTSPQLASEAGRRYGVSIQNTPWAENVKKNRFYMVFNTDQLLRLIEENFMFAYRLGANSVMLNAVLGPCEYMELMIPDWQKAQMNIVMKDKNINVLQLIVRGLDNL